jgi:phosphoribosyl 1,2-cyclic phosphodiesterase|tara:strand:+ start:221 stop:1081 length:861 start_codon:yes stop_codon:yes gene_type:complete
VGSRAKRDAIREFGMSLAFTHLGTGSRGNATLVESSDAKVLIDQGFSGKQLETRLARMEIKPDEIDAIVLTHHHGDHGGGAAIAERRWGIPIYCNDRTASALNLDLRNVHLFESLEALSFAEDFALLPVPVPHSGADNVAFIASHRGERGAVITDLGSWTDELINHVSGCQHISIEANYDNNRLWNGPYPMRLKDRIAGRGGHLSNDQTGQFLSHVVSKDTRSIVLTHLSEKNNAPHLAESTVLYHLDEVFEGDIQISLQDGPEFTHHIGQNESERISRSGLTLRG